MNCRADVRTKQHQDKTSSESLWCQRNHAVCGCLWLFSRQRARSLLVPPGPPRPPRPLLCRESDGDWIKPALLVRLEKAILHRPLLPEEDRPASSRVCTRMKRIKAREGGRKSRIFQSWNSKHQGPSSYVVAMRRSAIGCGDSAGKSKGGRRRSSTSQCDLEPGAWKPQSMCPGTSRYVHGRRRALIRCRNGLTCR